MLKLTLPDADDDDAELVRHPRVLLVVALSGGYRRDDEEDARLPRNPGVIASFSRALTDGLEVDQSDEAFDVFLDQSLASVWAASRT